VFPRAIFPAVHPGFIRDSSLVVLITTSRERRTTIVGRLVVAFELNFEELRSTINEIAAEWEAGRTDFITMSERERLLLLGYTPGPIDPSLEESERTARRTSRPSGPPRTKRSGARRLTT
jgi:hypothetical protein